MKNKMIILIAMLVTSAMNGIAQNNDYVSLTETRTSKPYHYIHIKGEMKVDIVQNEVPGVTVEGSNYQLGNTVTMLRNDTLFVYQANTRKGDRKTLVTINVDNIVSLEVSGKTKVDCSGLINTDYLTIRAYAGAQIKIDVRALKIDSKAVGCGFIDLSGSTASNVESIDECSTIDSHLLDVMERRRNSDNACYEC